VRGSPWRGDFLATAAAGVMPMAILERSVTARYWLTRPSAAIVGLLPATPGQSP
jgi:hypothetical protein